MIDNKLHTPEGVKDYLPYECSFKTEIEKRIESVFFSYGFSPIKSPTLEYTEVFEEKGSVNSSQMYKFLDRDGSILALRSDMTPPIARISATAYEKGDIPLRLYYVENAFRYNENYQGKLREFTQAGIELIGINSLDSDSEVIAVSINSLLATGLEDFRIDIGQVKFFNAILEEAGFDYETCNKIQNCIIEKDYVSVEKIAESSNIKNNVKELLIQLPLLVGGIEIINKARCLTNSQKALDALIYLENIYSRLNDYGLSKYISFDLSMIGHLGYYTGLIFRGYTYGTGFSIIDGGRYDNLIKNYGADYPSVGFAIKINDLMSALENQKISIPVQSIDTLLVYTEKGRHTALHAADELRIKHGLNIENSLLQDNIEKNIEYAKKRKMGGILYFLDSERVRIINVITNDISEISISELLNSEE